ncbi:hypothetical protein [Carnobacterium maltaromaticum]|uniref:hypothetical protein n=1 Tax=Carnobacterium maltaromaticum TaxID=2751 RepID=UPI00295F2FB5|nr:hypothetical protein [Carnobacterium maltaromaticum]
MNPNQYQKKKELPMVIKLLIALVLGVIFAVITAAVVIINNMYLSGTLAVVFAIGIIVYKITARKRSKY